MEWKRKEKTLILIIGIALIGVAGYLYYHRETREDKREQIVSTTTTELEAVTETQEAAVDRADNSIKNESDTEKMKEKASTTKEKKQNVKLPDNYEWDRI